MHFITLTAEKIQRLRDARLFFDEGIEHSRLRVGEIIRWGFGAKPEKYSGFFGTNNLMDLGSYSYTFSDLPPGIQVGRYCSIGRGMRVPLPNHPIERITSSPVTYDSRVSVVAGALRDYGVELEFRPHPQRRQPVLGHDVWVGNDVSILAGVRVGHGAVLAASAVVTRNVEPFSIVGGNPAKHIKYRFDEYTRFRILNSRWWECDFIKSGASFITKNLSDYVDDLESIKSELAHFEDNVPDLSFLLD